MIVKGLPDEFEIYKRADSLSCTFSENFLTFIRERRNKQGI